MASKLYNYYDIIYSGKSTIYHVVEFDGRDFASGLYYYRIQAGEFQKVKKMLLIK